MIPQDQKTVLLIGFGSPNPLDPRPFLFEVFSDEIASPIMRYGLVGKIAAHILARIASDAARKRYLSISGFEKSAIIVSDLAQRFERYLVRQGLADAKVLVAMRYGEPPLQDVLEATANDGIHDITCIPLYPHQAIATTGSIEAEIKRVCAHAPCRDMNINIVGPWYNKEEFVMAWVDAIRESLRAFPIAVRDRVHLLFTAHAIPVVHLIEKGDEYTNQIIKSARLINDSLGRILPMSIAFQNAPKWGKWSEPSVSDELRLLGFRGVRNCLIAPISFIYDNVETWCDLDMDILPMAHTFGIDRLKRVSPPIDSERLLNALAQLVTGARL